MPGSIWNGILSVAQFLGVMLGGMTLGVLYLAIWLGLAVFPVYFGVGIWRTACERFGISNPKVIESGFGVGLVMSVAIGFAADAVLLRVFGLSLTFGH